MKSFLIFSLILALGFALHLHTAAEGLGTGPVHQDAINRDECLKYLNENLGNIDG